MKTGQNYRLLSESEREYAARAGTTMTYYFGNTISKSQANFGRHIGGTALVGSYRANTFRLYDMHDNVWEWVEDCFHYDYVDAPTDGSAWLSECIKEIRVLRGGSWYNKPEYLRSAARVRGLRYWPGGRSDGFRVARTLTP